MKIIVISRRMGYNETFLAERLSEYETLEVLWITGTSKQWDQRKILNKNPNPENKDKSHYLTIQYIKNKKDIFDFFTFLPKLTKKINTIFEQEKDIKLIIFPKEDKLIKTALKTVEHKAEMISLDLVNDTKGHNLERFFETMIQFNKILEKCKELDSKITKLKYDYRGDDLN